MLFVIGFLAFFMLIVIGIVCRHFPRRCDKCGKLRAFISTRVDKANYYTAGGFIVSTHYLSRKKCISCGHEGEETLTCKAEELIRG